MALEASPIDMAVRYDQFINANVAIAGSSFHDHSGLRTQGINTTLAQAARQNANSGPRTDSDQSTKSGALAKNPPLLHSTAASAIRRQPRSLEVADVSGES